ncbi:MAG: hypothetical protein QNK92_16215 [Amylibacter sp.]
MKNPEDELKKKLQKELNKKAKADDAKWFEDQAKEKMENEIGKALKKLFD